jgi:hypothetical protein
MGRPYRPWALWFVCRYPGRWPGLLWGGPLGLGFWFGHRYPGRWPGLLWGGLSALGCQAWPFTPAVCLGCYGARLWRSGSARREF